MLSNKVFCLVTFLLLSLSACSGGGGGHDGGHVDAHDDSLLAINGFGSDYKSKGLRVIHAAIDGSPYQIARENNVLFSPFRFSFSNYINLSGGSYDLQVNLTNEPVFPFTLDFSEYKRQTLLICSYGNQVIGNNLIMHKEDKAGIASIRVIHSVFGAEQVRVVIDGNEFLTDYCSSSEYFETSNTLAQVTVYRVVDGLPIYSQNLELEIGNNYSLVIGGSLTEDYFTILLRD